MNSIVIILESDSFKVQLGKALQRLRPAARRPVAVIKQLDLKKSHSYNGQR